MIPRKSLRAAVNAAKEVKELEVKEFFGQFMEVIDQVTKSNGRKAFKIKFKGLNADYKPLEKNGKELIQIGSFTIPEMEDFEDYIEDDKYIFEETDIFAVRGRKLPYTGEREGKTTIWMFELFQRVDLTPDEEIDEFMEQL